MGIIRFIQDIMIAKWLLLLLFIYCCADAYHLNALKGINIQGNVTEISSGLNENDSSAENSSESNENDSSTNLPDKVISDWIKKATRKTVAIIGGGASGLGAFNTLYTNGMKDVVLFEAQDKLGGRIRTFREGNLTLEDGAEWIHGGPRNIVYRIAQKLNGVDTSLLDDVYDIRVVRENGEVYEGDVEAILKGESLINDTYENGIWKEYENQSLGKYYYDRFDKEIAFGKRSPVLNALLHYIAQKIDDDEGTGGWEYISARDADAFELFGYDYKWINGYDTLLNHLIEPIPSSSFYLSTPVSRIIWDLGEEEGVLLVTEDNQLFIVDHLIVTVSVAFLKKNHNSMFFPSIPLELKSALNGTILGVSNKIFIGWSLPWWGYKPMLTKILWTKRDLPTEMDWLYGIVRIANVEGKSSILSIFISGKYSLKMEKLSEDVIKSHVLYLLRKIYSKNIVPEPTVFRRTKWNSNRWILGSYSSFVTLDGEKTGIHSRQMFRQPLVNKFGNNAVRWAGEYTHDTRYGTVDGALLTGIREARKILRHY